MYLDRTRLGRRQLGHPEVGACTVPTMTALLDDEAYPHYLNSIQLWAWLVKITELFGPGQAEWVAWCLRSVGHEVPWQ